MRLTIITAEVAAGTQRIILCVPAATSAVYSDSHLMGFSFPSEN
jgi:hypothetical protein